MTRSLNLLVIKRKPTHDSGFLFSLEDINHGRGAEESNLVSSGYEPEMVYPFHPPAMYFYYILFHYLLQEDTEKNDNVLLISYGLIVV